jgi:U4/U6.U5 tri-snRNP-associated protein 1
MSDRKRKLENDSAAGGTSAVVVPAEMDNWKGNVPKAMVTEQNGEISCSVDETNRIRALLGMKPLNISGQQKSSDQVAVDNLKAKRELEQKEIEAVAIRDRIESAKNKRLLHSSLGGESLGTVSAADAEIASASNWVQRSREVEKLNREKEKAKLAAKRIEEEESSLLSTYEAKDLKGVQVMHSASDFDIGQDVVLTLADTNILDTDDNGRFKGKLSNAADILENVNIADRDRRLDREQRQKRLRQPVYAGYDDHEFAEGGPSKVLLAQYDADKKRGPQMILEGGKVNDVHGNAVSASVNTGEAEIKHNDAENLTSDYKPMQDFYTPTEYATFAKSKIKDKDKKKRKIRKKQADENDEEGGSGNMISLLEAELEQNGDMANERGSRTNIKKNSDADAAGRRAGYDLAVQGAADKLSNHRAFQKPNSRRPNAEVDDDADLQRAVAASRRLALLQHEKHNTVPQSADSGADTVRMLAAQAAHVVQAAVASEHGMIDDSVNASNLHLTNMSKNCLLPQAADRNNHGAYEDADNSSFEVDSEGRCADGSLVFTTTTEFTTRLQARLNERARSKAELAVKAAAASTNRDIDDDDESKSRKSRKMTSGDGESSGKPMEAMDVDSDDETGSDGEILSIHGDDHQLDFVQNQPLVAKGMAATLALLKGSGDLKQKPELAGRAKDTREFNPSAKDFDVKLEYRDENGKLLTVKEAYRQLCYRFHGYGPGKKKQEKRIQAEELRNKSASSKASENVGTMKSLVKAQEATGKAHVVVQVSNSDVFIPSIS